MKKSLFILLAASVLGTACTKELIENNKPEIEEVPYELVAHMEGTTKTSLGTDNTVNWVENDKIGMFAIPSASESADPTVYRTLTTTNSGASAIFNGTIPQGYKATYALYPDNLKATLKNDKIYTTLPSIQKPEVETFANDVNLAVAKIDANGAAAFKNVCALLEVTVPEIITTESTDKNGQPTTKEETVISMTLQGNNNESIAGKVSLTYKNAVPTVTSEENLKYITLYDKNAPGEQRELVKGKSYVFTILPTNFTKGITLTFVTKTGKQFTVRSENPLDCSKRNSHTKLNGTPTVTENSKLNNYIQWISGKSIKFGNISCDKTMVTSPVTLISESSQQITGNGVYFIESDVVATITEDGFTNAIIATVNDNSRVTVNGMSTKRTAFSDTPGQTEFVGFKGIKYIAGKQDHLFSIGPEFAGQYDGFGTLAIANCEFTLQVKADDKNRTNTLFFASKNQIQKIVLVDSDIKSPASEETKLFNFGKRTFTCNLYMRNNIIYTDNIVKNFYVVEGKNATLDALTFNSNTLYKTYPTPTSGLFTCSAFTTSISSIKNLFYYPDYKTTVGITDKNNTFTAKNSTVFNASATNSPYPDATKITNSSNKVYAAYTDSDHRVDFKWSKEKGAKFVDRSNVAPFEESQIDFTDLTTMNATSTSTKYNGAHR